MCRCRFVGNLELITDICATDAPLAVDVIEVVAAVSQQLYAYRRRVCKRYKEQGLEELIRNKYTSHRRALTEEKEKEILGRFEKAAEAGQEVTAKEIKAAFDEVRGKNTGSGYIYMLLKRHGWRKVMPRSKHPKAANEEACEASKKLNNVCWIPEKTYSQNYQEKSV